MATTNDAPKKNGRLEESKPRIANIPDIPELYWETFAKIAQLNGLKRGTMLRLLVMEKVDNYLKNSRAA